MGDIEQYNGGIEYASSSDIVADAKAIIDSSQRAARGAVNVFLVIRNWLLGRRIAEEELKELLGICYLRMIMGVRFA